MKKLNGNRKLFNISLLFILTLMNSCSKEKEYSTTMIYENTINQGVKIIAYMDYRQLKEEWALYILPQQSASTIISRYSSETIFERTTQIKLLFNDGRYIVYDRIGNTHLESLTNLFNLSLYHKDGDSGVFKLQISEKHYNESKKEQSN